jgi:hypothetical protein
VRAENGIAYVRRGGDVKGAAITMYYNLFIV